MVIATSIKIIEINSLQPVTNDNIDVYILFHLINNRFTLGTLNNIKIQNYRKISIIIKEVDTESHSYTWLENENMIKKTDKRTFQETITENKDHFLATCFTNLILPAKENNFEPLFGLTEAEKMILMFLNIYKNRLCCLYGPKGNGKSKLLEKIQLEHSEFDFVFLEHELITLRKGYLDNLFYRLAKYRKNVVLCICDIDEFNNDILNDVYESLIDRLIEDSSVKIIITCQDKSNLRDTQNDTTNIFQPALSNPDKLALLKSILQETNSKNIDDSYLGSLVKSLKGFSACDIKMFIENVNFDHPELTMEVLKEAILNTNYLPSHLSNMISDFEQLKWTDIGGYEDVKDVMKEDIEEPIKKGGKIPNGIILYGPTGCSKTMFSRALAAECEMNMFVVTAKSIMSSLVGESEARLQSILMQAKANAPSILLIDHLDILFPKRENKNNSAVSGRLLNTLMTFINGVETTEDQRFIFMAATNYIDKIDEALIRPGRVDLMIKIDLPDQISRESILEIIFKDNNFKVDKEVLENIPKIAKILINKTGALIVQFGRKIKKIAARDFPVGSMPLITLTHVYEAIALLSDNK